MKPHNEIIAEITDSVTKTLEYEDKEDGYITFTMEKRGFVGNSNFKGWKINFLELEGKKVTIQIIHA